MNLISVLIPTYKPKNYIKKCLKSIDNQTLSKSLFCVYIALNGSDSDDLDFIQQLLRDFKFEYKLIVISKSGVSNARNLLIESSSEPFITFVDDDDFISESYLEELLTVSSNTTMGISNVKNFHQNTQRVYEHYIGKSFLKIINGEESKYKTRKYYSTPWAKLIHRDIIGNTRFNTNLSIGEDALFMAQISHRIQKINKTSSTATYFVNNRPESASRRSVNKVSECKRILYLLNIYIKMLLLDNTDKKFLITRILATLKHLKRVAR